MTKKTEKRAIKHSNLPPRSPLVFTIAIGLLLDRLDAAGWVWGAVGLLALILWVSFFAALFLVTYVDLFPED